MSDKFVTNPSDHFVEGQTVVVKVTKVDEEKQRMLVSLRLSDCRLGSSSSTSLLLLSQCLEELHGVRSLMGSQGRGRARAMGRGKMGRTAFAVTIPVVGMSCWAFKNFFANGSIFLCL